MTVFACELSPPSVTWRARTGRASHGTMVAAARRPRKAGPPVTPFDATAGGATARSPTSAISDGLYLQADDPDAEQPTVRPARRSRVRHVDDDPAGMGPGVEHGIH